MSVYGEAMALRGGSMPIGHRADVNCRGRKQLDPGRCQLPTRRCQFAEGRCQFHIEPMSIDSRLGETAATRCQLTNSRRKLPFGDCNSHNGNVLGHSASSAPRVPWIAVPANIPITTAPIRARGDPSRQLLHPTPRRLPVERREPQYKCVVGFARFMLCSRHQRLIFQAGTVSSGIS